MLKVMVIESDEKMRKLIREGLADEFEVIETGDPAEALGFALKSAPDCILLDLSLPGFSGLELCQTLSSVSYTKTIPVFVMVSDLAHNSRESYLNLGARDAFRRPPEFPSLKAALRAVGGNQKPKQLEDVQVQLKVILKLMGKTDKGKAFELLTATDQVSMNGFQCRCSVPVQMDSIVEVIHVHSEGERRVGRARLLSAEWGGMPWQTFRFQFTERTSPWII
jgi:DNA-binding response OmpR family regulator